MKRIAYLVGGSRSGETASVDAQARELRVRLPPPRSLHRPSDGVPTYVESESYLLHLLYVGNNDELCFGLPAGVTIKSALQELFAAYSASKLRK